MPNGGLYPHEDDPMPRPKKGKRGISKKAKARMPVSRDMYDALRKNIKAYFESKTMTVPLNTAMMLQEAYSSGFEAGWNECNQG